MNATMPRRFNAALGLVLAAAVAIWWLGSTRLALERGTDAAVPAADALAASWIVRAMVLAVVATTLGALRGVRQSAQAATLLLAPAWPLVALAWSASTLAAPWPWVMEAVLLAAAAVLAWAGQGLRRLLPSDAWAQPMSSGVGVILASLLWAMRGHWLAPWF
jgi:hypothetical protein